MGREGFLLAKLFEKYCSVNEVDDIKGVYLEISRRAAMTAMIKTEEELYDALAFPYSGEKKQLFKERFNIYIDEEDMNVNEVALKYKSEILKEAERERINYQRYFQSLELEESFAIVDSQLYGSTQYYLSKILNKKIPGFYFCACLDDSNKYLKENTMEGCFFSKPGENGKTSNIFKYAPFVEAFFTAPYGMLEYVNDDGSMCYSTNMKNQERFGIRYDMCKGIGQYLEGLSTLIPSGYKVTEKDRNLADTMFGLLMNNGMKCLDEMKCAFYYDNGMLGKKESPIWE